MWKGLIHQYKEFLPVTDQTPALTLHEGNTPLIHLPKLSEKLGIELHVKTEGVRSFPFTEELKANYQYHYSQVLNEEGAIDADRLKRSNIWQYKHLPSGVQNAIANVISDMCRNPGLKALPGEQARDAAIYLFRQATNLPASLLQLIQTFDYTQTVPKLVLYHTEQNGELTRSCKSGVVSHWRSKHFEC